MPDRTFQHFQAEFFRLYQEGKPREALSLVEAAQGEYPERTDTLLNWQMCMLALSGQDMQAVQVFRQAVDLGYWWNAALLHGDPDLASLQGKSEFETLVAICQDREDAALKNSHPELFTFAPPESDGTPLPLVLFFHGRGGNSAAFRDYWQGLPGRGWLAALAQSSQVMSARGFAWDDWRLARQEALAHYRSLVEQYPINPGRVILAGFSQGGGLALDLALTQAIPARGVLGVGPFLENFAELEAAVQSNPVSGLRAYLVTGGQDNDRGIFAKIEALLRSTRIPFERENHPDLAHEFPPDFDATLERAIPFLIG